MKSNQLVVIHDSQAVTSSVVISQLFEKRHDDVIRAVRKVIEQCPKDFNDRNFTDVKYTDKKGEIRQAYELTRDAFTLVAMGFTGEKALQFKLAYIQAFNQMETALKAQSDKKLYANLDHAHQREELFRSQINELKDELLNAYRHQNKLISLKKPTPRPLTAQDKTTIHLLFTQGLSKNAIARQLNRSSSVIRRALSMISTVSTQTSLFE